MKFLSIELEHIFSYDDKIEVDLSGTTPEHNVVLIWGRNGVGKTSFLNALKLLFTGVDWKVARTVGFPPRTLPQRQFVVGDGAGWSGLINRQARLRAERHGGSVTARVRAVWAADGETITAERQWVLENGAYRESILVFDGSERFVREAAEARLGDFLPRDFVRFFFFDGEDIKSLAEEGDRKQEDFDRLLHISFIKDAADELRHIVTDRQRIIGDGGLYEQIHDVEVNLAKAVSAIELTRKQIERLDDELVDAAAVLRRLTTLRENLSSGASEAQRETLEARRAGLTSDLAAASEDLAANLPGHVPMLANLGLVRAALAAVETRLSAAGASEVVLIRRVQDDLPGWIRSAPVKLEDAQVTQLAKALSAHLDAIVAPTAEAGLFARLDLGRADRLRTALLRWTTSGSDQLRMKVAQLSEAARLRGELLQVNDALAEIEVGSQAKLEEYKKVVADIAALEERIASWNQEKGAAQSRLKDHEAAEVSLLKHQRRLREASEEAAKGHEELRLLNSVVRALNEVAEALRAERRGEIAALINQRFKILLSGHPLVERIDLDENYTMMFMDEADRPIGRMSLSSGMKQLAATALLWAMKDVAGQDLPVVIDTPLGRIDRTNQTHLLTNYYPRLADQVIVLPTDAEIDKTKLDLLKPHIWRQYTLSNDLNGEGTTIAQKSLVEG